MTIKVIPIRKNPKCIVITEFDKGIYHHYHLNEPHRTSPFDLGVWHVKYKKPS